MISRKLFLGMPTFCNTLVNLNVRIKDLYDIRLITFNANNQYQKNEFMDQQQQKLREAAKSLEDIHEQLQVRPN